ncbi:MAG: serine/threonine protein kinase [Deltaproteobacteria bacterium]|nr:serine/threonine protein kinase [Deltaproteobacteria bacterium]
MAGQAFGRYELQSLLATGGMGEVYLAVDRGAPGADPGFERLCVVKRIRPELVTNADAVGMFAREAACAALLSHGNIVQLLDHGAINGQPYVALEYVHGVNLKAVLTAQRARGVQLPLPEVVHIAHAVALALRYAHARRKPDGTRLDLVHRDISPQNVLVSVEGEVKLTDFGMAKGATRVQYQTGEMSLKGKIAYLSPEQASGEAVEQRSDLFSLGTVLYELCTLQHPFGEDGDALKVMDRIKRAEVGPPTELRPDLPPALVRVLAGCLMREPRDRFPSAAEVVSLLEELRAATLPPPGQLRLAAHLSSLGLAPPDPSWGPRGTPTRESVRPVSSPPQTQPSLNPAQLLGAPAGRPAEESAPGGRAVAAAAFEELSTGGLVVSRGAGPAWVAAGALGLAAGLAWAWWPAAVPPHADPPPEAPAAPADPAPRAAEPRERPAVERTPRARPRARIPAETPRDEEPAAAAATPAPPPEPAAPASATPAAAAAVRPPAAAAPTPAALPLVLPASPGLPPQTGMRFNAHRRIRVVLNGAQVMDALQGRLALPEGTQELRFILGSDRFLTVTLRDAGAGARVAQLATSSSGRVTWDGREVQGSAQLPVNRGGSVLSLADEGDALVVTVR